MATHDARRLSFTHLEDLPNETIYEIFAFLDTYDVYEAFSNLNNRFEIVLMCSTYPLHVRMKSLSKCNMRRYYKEYVLPNIDRVGFLHLWNLFTLDLGFPCVEHLQNFVSLKTLVLEDIKSANLLKHLSILPNLNSLIIHQMLSKYSRSIDFNSIIALPALKYCRITSGQQILFESNDNPNDRTSPLEHLVINSKVDFAGLAQNFSSLPHLHRLSIDYLDGSSPFRWKKIAHRFKKLTHVSFNLKNTSFDRFEAIIRINLANIEVLRLSVTNNDGFLNSSRWEQLIVNSMKYLRVFDMQYFYRIERSTSIDYDALIKSFPSSFWTERQWYFAHQKSPEWTNNWSIFYSIQPYKRRLYRLYGTNKDINPSIFVQNHLHSVRHLHIENQSAIRCSSVYFPNVRELTLSANNSYLDYSTMSNLQHLIPLNQLDQITIDCSSFNFHRLIEILHWTPNCSKLRLHSISIDEIELDSLEIHPHFHIVSNRNQISELILQSTCTLKMIQFLIKLCSRLQDLTINVRETEFRSVLKLLLLPRTDQNTHQLVSLTIKSSGDGWLEKAIEQSDSLKQLNEFSVEQIDYARSYLWW